MDFCTLEWLLLKPKGLIFEGGHFVFILENAEKRAVLPLRYPVHTVDLLSVGGGESMWRKSLASLLSSTLPAWGIRFQRCVFITQQKGKHTVHLYYIKDGEVSFIKAPFEQVLG